MARPSSYTQEIADEICRRLAGGESLRRICEDEHMPVKSTVLLWVVSDREGEPHQGFSDQYMQARDAAGYSHGDRVADLAELAATEGIDPQAARAAMDGFKWAAERMSPKKHSPKQEVEHFGQGGGPIPVQFVAPEQYKDPQEWASSQDE